jgi:hypothetical protein
VRVIISLAVLVLTLAGCAPNVPQIGTPQAIKASCSEQFVPRITAIENIVSSIKDASQAPSKATLAEMLADEKSKTGGIATWKDLLVILPRTAASFGESDQYIRVHRVAITNVPEDMLPPRPIDMEVRDHGTYRWFSFQAYDTQNICVEGRRSA